MFGFKAMLANDASGKEIAEGLARISEGFGLFAVYLKQRCVALLGATAKNREAAARAGEWKEWLRQASYSWATLRITTSLYVRGWLCRAGFDVELAPQVEALRKLANIVFNVR